MSTNNSMSIYPQQYIHVLDNNSNLTRLIEGPQIFSKQEHEKIVQGPSKMITLPPRYYCMIKDPVKLPLSDPVEIQFGKIETRTHETHSKPFALYPGEEMIKEMEPYITISANSGLKLKALYDSEQMRVGTEWIIKGPETYIPQWDQEIIGVVKSEIIKPNTALRLKAKRDTIDINKIKRSIGEEWLVRKVGGYLPTVDEEVIGVVKGEVLNDQTALKLKASNYFKDVYGKERKPGQQWIVTYEITQVHILDIYEELVEKLEAITLNAREYCVVENPYEREKGVNLWGTQELRKGEQTFFLYQNEVIVGGIQNVYVLGEEEALLLVAQDHVVDQDGTKHLPGEKWMIKGPCEYIPPCEISIVEERSAIPLDQNEGIYIRDLITGEVRSFKGSTYLLQSHEELWKKELPEQVEQLMGCVGRDKTRMVGFKAPHNTAVQLYDLAQDKARVVFGPELILLEPDEVFTVLSLSGGKPKKEGVIKAMALQLGPDFMTDIVIVETLDHARLSLKLSYNWQFKFDKNNFEEHQKLFSVKDFIGDTCKTMASRVRGSVSTVTFEYFHHHSSDQIKQAVFGKNPDGKFKDELFFSSNNLLISSVDIQAVEITDQKTREMLSKSINLAIEITSKSQEANSKHEAERIEQIAKGQLERQKLEAAADAEKAKIKLLELEAQSESVKKKGDAIAVAKAKAEGALIAGHAEIEQAELEVKALQIEADSEIAELEAKYQTEIQRIKAQTELELTKATQLADIEISKFSQLVESIGKETIVEISKAGPELKAQLLQGLGLQGYLITDGKNPVNLFQTAEGFINYQQ